MSGHFINQSPTLPQKIDSREGLLGCNMPLNAVRFGAKYNAF